jgi:hypothetical protein
MSQKWAPVLSKCRKVVTGKLIRRIWLLWVTFWHPRSFTHNDSWSHSPKFWFINRILGWNLVQNPIFRGFWTIWRCQGTQIWFLDPNSALSFPRLISLELTAMTMWLIWPFWGFKSFLGCCSLVSQQSFVVIATKILNHNSSFGRRDTFDSSFSSPWLAQHEYRTLPPQKIRIRCDVSKNLPNFSRFSSH